MVFDMTWNSTRASLLVLLRRINKEAALAYAPWAPTFSVPEGERGNFLEELSAGLKPYLPGDCICIRYDLPWRSPYAIGTDIPSDTIRELRMNFGTQEKNLRKAPTDIQPVHTRIIDLEAKEDELLDSMKPKTRYNIRLAFRKGILVNDAPFDRLSEWYRMYKDTVRRNGISVHSYTQFKKLLSTKKEHVLPNTDVHLLMAKKGARPLAGMILVIHGDTATYLYGASSSGMRNLMPTYSLQWEAIRMARGYNCTRYDMFGIPPDDNPAHPMHGLYRFKTGFGGYTIRRQGCWDFPLNDRLYRELAGVEPAGPGYHL